jgi:sulfite reductase (NADPH) hemoprotein beta-component
MYQYTDFDKQFVKLRAAQFRDQLERWQAGKLADDEFRPLRLQNGWYVQRYAPMLRVAVPYGELSSAQLRVLATIARDYDEPEAGVYAGPEVQGALGSAALPTHYAHFTTRQNVQFNWIPLSKSADVMDLLASVHMHGIQTSGNCIRNITSDARAGIAADESSTRALRRDPAPVEHAAPRVRLPAAQVQDRHHGASEDRAATAWHDVGLHLVKNEAGELGFRVLVGGGMGRTPIPAR